MGRVVSNPLGLAIDALLSRDGSLILRLCCLAGGIVATLLFVFQQWRRPYPVLDPRVFATSAMVAVGALLTAVQFGYWALLVYLPLFLKAGLAMSMDMAGLALLTATLPMLLIPLIGGRLVTHLGWRRFFALAFGIMIAGDGLLVYAALAADPLKRLALTMTGMLTIGVGAAFANPQMSGVALTLAPPTQAGMTSAMTMIVRQAGFSISIAALGASLRTTDAAALFAVPFSLAALVTVLTTIPALLLLPAKSEPDQDAKCR